MSLICPHHSGNPDKLQGGRQGDALVEKMATCVFTHTHTHSTPMKFPETFRETANVRKELELETPG